MKLEVTFALYTKTNEHKLTQVDTFQVEFQLSLLLSDRIENWELQRYFIFFREITVFVYILATTLPPVPHTFSRILSRISKSSKLRFEKLEKRSKHKKSKLIRKSRLRCRSYCALHPTVYCFSVVTKYSVTNELSRIVEKPIGCSTVQLWKGHEMPNSFLLLGRWRRYDNSRMHEIIHSYRSFSSSSPWRRWRESTRIFQVWSNSEQWE